MTRKLATIFTLVALLLCAADWHVRTSAELAAALTNPDVQPGDVVLLHSGTYHGTFKPTLQGTPDKPITIRSAPGEWAVIDGSRTGQLIKNVAVLDIATRGWLVLRDFEVTNSDPEREIVITGSNPPERRGNSIDVRAPGVVLDGLVIHDCGQGPGVWVPATQSSVHNCVVNNNGWKAPDRGHGHGIYTQSADERVIAGNVFGPQFGETVAMYGSDQARLDHFRWRHNVLVGGVLFGGSCPVNDLVLEGNVFSSVAECGYDQGVVNRGLRVTGNWFLDRLGLKYWADDTVVVEGNVFYGNDLGGTKAIGMQTPISGGAHRYTIDRNMTYRTNDGYCWWKPGHLWTWNTWQADGYDPDGTYHDRRPDATDNRAITLGTDPNRRIVALFNFGGKPSVAVSLPWINTGNRYRIRHALNYHAIAAEGEYAGEPVVVPIGTPDSVAIPIGWDKRLVKPDVRFGVFVVERLQAVLLERQRNDK